MKKTNQAILNGALSVFLEKGYLQATTQEIAKRAEVAEITLFRKFKTKKALFEHTIYTVLKDVFSMAENEDIYKMKSSDFYEKLLTDRLQVVLEHKALIRLLISESIREHLPKDLNFTETIYKQLKQMIDYHYIYHHLEVDTEFKAKVIAGFLLSAVVLTQERVSENTIESYVQILTQ